MAIGRGIDEDGEVFFVQRPSTEQVLDALLETDRRRENALQRDLMAWDANMRATLTGEGIHAL